MTLKAQETERQVCFDDMGDLRLEVGPKRSPYIVCSRSLARASSVFKKMLYGGYGESKPQGNEQWVVQLPDDNPRAMRLLLNIIHGRFNNMIPPQTENCLFEVAIMTDKYALTHLLGPWAQSWLDRLCTDKPRDDSETRIWIARELGDYGTFQAEHDNLVLTSRWQHDLEGHAIHRESGGLVDEWGIRLDSYIMLNSIGIIGTSSNNLADYRFYANLSVLQTISQRHELHFSSRSWPQLRSSSIISQVPERRGRPGARWPTTRSSSRKASSARLSS